MSKLTARFLTVVALLTASLAGATLPASATPATATPSQALACATPCTWLSGAYEARINALKAAEKQAMLLAQLGYSIELVTTIQEQTTIGNVHKGKVRYVGR